MAIYIERAASTFSPQGSAAKPTRRVKREVRYLLIGGQAVIAHSEPRYTKGVDLWIEPTPCHAGNGIHFRP